MGIIQYKLDPTEIEITQGSDESDGVVYLSKEQMVSLQHDQRISSLELECYKAKDEIKSRLDALRGVTFFFALANLGLCVAVLVLLLH